MKKIITDEKFYITDIPKDKGKIKDLIVFLNDGKNWNDSQYDIATNFRLIIYDESTSDYGYANHIEPKDYHTVITYDDLLANYLPKDTKVDSLEFNNWDKLIDDAIKDSIEEEYLVGETHNQKSIQPIDYIMKNGLDFLEGSVIECVTLHKDRNGSEDIKKAIQYLEFILKYQYEGYLK